MTEQTPYDHLQEEKALEESGSLVARLGLRSRLIDKAKSLVVSAPIAIAQRVKANRQHGALLVACSAMAVTAAAMAVAVNANARSSAAVAAASAPAATPAPSSAELAQVEALAAQAAATIAELRSAATEQSARLEAQIAAAKNTAQGAQTGVNETATKLDAARVTMDGHVIRLDKADTGLSDALAVLASHPVATPADLTAVVSALSSAISASVAAEAATREAALATASADQTARLDAIRASTDRLSASGLALGAALTKAERRVTVLEGEVVMQNDELAALRAEKVGLADRLDALQAQADVAAAQASALALALADSVHIFQLPNVGDYPHVNLNHATADWRCFVGGFSVTYTGGLPISLIVNDVAGEQWLVGDVAGVNESWPTVQIVCVSTRIAHSP